MSCEKLLDGWQPYCKGYTVGRKGSENGEILLDEHFRNEARITLERCKKYHAVTCGIYGMLLHTAFFTESEAVEKYEEMKQDLAGFLEVEQTGENAMSFCDKFTKKY